MTTEASKRSVDLSTDFKGVNFSSSNVPGFLSKLWLLVEEQSTDELIGWSPSRNSFIVQNQTRFAKEILPKFFKHSNMASFIRQLNMYGFRKKLNLEHGSLKVDSDDIEFQHPNFLKGRPDLLENIKRKVSARDESKLKMEDVHQILTDVQDMKGKQDNITGTLDSIQRENQILWREVVFLRQRHEKQQKIVNRLIEFLLTMVKPVSLKRKQQLMIEGTSDPSKYARLASGSDNMQLVQPVTFDTDLDSLPDIGAAPSSSVVLSDITDDSLAMAAQTYAALTEEADGTTPACEPVPAVLDPAVLDPSLFELDIPPVSPDRTASPTVTTPPSVQPHTAKVPSPYRGAQYDTLWLPSESDSQPGTEIASLFSADDDQPATGGQGSLSAVPSSSSGASSRAVMKRMLSHDEQRGELGEHVNTVQENLDMIQHMLTTSVNIGGSYNLDMGSLLDIFNTDPSANINDTDLFPILADTNSQNTTDENPDNQDDIKGTEIVQYNQLSSNPFTSYDEDSLLESLNDDAAALEKVSQAPDTNKLNL